MRRRAAALSVVTMIVAVWGCSARKGANADPFEALSTEVDQQVTDASRAETMRALTEALHR